MNKEDKHFIEGYEKLLNKGYCNCNEMNCIDNNSPRRILNIVKQLQQKNKELHNKIDKLEDKIKQMDNRFKNGLCVDNYLGGKKTRKLFEEMYEILKESDVDE